MGDLGGIDKQYDVAASTACGGLNHLVTRTVDGAQKCIDYLRTHELGRATFIVLEKIQYLTPEMAAFDVSKTLKKEKCPRLFDLVRPRDEEVRVAFFYAMRNTLVAKHLEQASKVAYEGKKCKYRVVSMKGELIELSGTMSGGGGKARNGLIGTSPKEFAKGGSGSGSGSSEALDNAMRDIEAELKTVEENHHVACKERDGCKKDKHLLEKELRTLTTWLKKTTTKLSKMVRLYELFVRVVCTSCLY